MSIGITFQATSWPFARGGHERTRGRKWMRLRKVVLIEEPVCRICGRRPSVEVDHIKPVCKGGTDERDNLQGTCQNCHEEKTRKELGLKKKKDPVDLKGYPIVNQNNIDG